MTREQFLAVLDHHDFFFESLRSGGKRDPIALRSVPFMLEPAQVNDHLMLEDRAPKHADPLILFTLAPLTLLLMAAFFALTEPSIDGFYLTAFFFAVTAFMAWCAFHVRSACNMILVSQQTGMCALSRRRFRTIQQERSIADTQIIVRPCQLKYRLLTTGTFEGFIVFMTGGQTTVVCAVCRDRMDANRYARTLSTATGMKTLHEDVLVKGFAHRA